MTGGVARFDCYPSDFLNGMVGLTADQIALYAVIIFLQYDRGEPILIEGREREIAIRAGMTRARLAKAADDLVALGKLHRDGGHVFNARTAKELEKIRERIAEKRAIGSKGGISTREKYAEKFNKNSDDHVADAGAAARANAPAYSPPPPPLPLKESPATAPLEMASASPSEDPSPPPRPWEPQGFVEFYAEYPKKVDRRSAAAKFATIIKSGVSIERLVEGARRYADACRAKRTEPKYIKSPEVWLNKGCWEDDLGGLPLAATPRAPADQDERHRTMLRMFCSTANWPFDDPEPGQPRCVIPMHILDEFRSQLPRQAAARIWPEARN